MKDNFAVIIAEGSGGACDAVAFIINIARVEYGNLATSSMRRDTYNTLVNELGESRLSTYLVRNRG